MHVRVLARNRISSMTNARTYVVVAATGLAVTTVLTDQVSSDTSSAAYHFVDGGRFSDFAVGGLVAYDFGPATLSLVATDEVYAHTTGGTPGVGNVTTPQGWTVFGEVSYKLCCFEEEAPVAPKKPMVYK